MSFYPFFDMRTVPDCLLIGYLMEEIQSPEDTSHR